MGFKDNHKKIMKLAEYTLGSKENATEWMSSRCKALGNVKPLDLLKTDEGTSAVEDIIIRIEYGGYS